MQLLPWPRLSRPPSTYKIRGAPFLTQPCSCRLCNVFNSAKHHICQSASFANANWTNMHECVHAYTWGCMHLPTCLRVYSLYEDTSTITWYTDGVGWAHADLVVECCRCLHLECTHQPEPLSRICAIFGLIEISLHWLQDRASLSRPKSKSVWVCTTIM